MQPLDSEVLLMERELKKLRENEGKHRDLESIRREAVERFASIGWVAKVDCYQTNTDAIAYNISLVDRCAPQPYGNDYERLQWEIRNDILEIEPEKKGLTSTFTAEGLHNTGLASKD